MPKLNGNYWGDEQEQDVIAWKEADTRKQFVLYDKLWKYIRHMAASVLARYFIHSPDFKDIRQDAINKLFCVMHKYDPERGHTAFSFCQTVLKNFYHEVARQKKGKVLAVKLEYLDDLEAPEFNYSWDWQPVDLENDYDFEPVFRRLEQARFRLTQYLHSHKRMPAGTRRKTQNEADYLLYTVEFLNQFKDSQGLSVHAIVENSMTKLNCSESYSVNLTQKHFGITGWVKNDWESKIDKKYDIGYIEDDFTPDAQVIEKQLHREKAKKYKHDYGFSQF